MLVPPPRPVLTLAPDIGELAPAQRAVPESCLAALTGRVSGVIVIGAETTASHHVLRLLTSQGTLVVIERAAPATVPAI